MTRRGAGSNTVPARLAPVITTSLLRGIWKELAQLKDREFWEVNDRGSNFDYLSDEQKAELPRFFSWFPALYDDAIQSMRKGMVEPSGIVSVPINLP